MAKQEDSKTTTPKKLTIKTETVLGSLYSQIVGIVVTDTDITLEFVYKNPRPGTEEAQVVARITLPRRAAEGLAKSIVDTVAQHEAKKKERYGRNN